MRKFLCLTFLVFAVGIWGNGAARADAPTVAVIGATGERAVPRDLVQRLEVGLSADDGIRLIDRQSIRQVLAEQTLTLTNTAQTADTIRLGQLLKAGLIIYLERVPHDERMIYQVRIVDTDSGIILSSRLLSEQLSPADITDLIRRVKQAQLKTDQKEAGLRYVGILQIRSEEPGTSLDGFSKLLEAYLTTALAASPEVIVLERDQLRYLQREADLTAGELALRSSAILLEGGVKYTDGRKRIQISVEFRRLSGNAPPPVTLDIADDPDRSTDQLNDVAALIREQLKVSPPTGSGMETAREAELFIEQIPLLLAGGRFEEAISKAEVALALQPGQESRYWAARAWYSLAQSLRQNENKPKPRITRVSRSRPEAQAETPDPEAEAAKRRQTHQLLGAYVRSYSLIRDLTRWHIAKPLQTEIPDPLAELERFDPNAEMERGTPLYYMVDGPNDPQAGALLQEIRDICRDYLQRQRDYYAGLYSDDPIAAVKYWETLFYAKGFLTDFNSYDANALADLATETFTAFQRFAADGLQLRLAGIRPLIQFKLGQTASPGEAALFEDLRDADDAWTRLLANRLLIRSDHLTYSRDVMRTFHDDILPAGEIWELEDAGLVPHYLRTALHRLAVSDPRNLTAVFKPVYEELLKPQHLRHLLEWNAQDLVWPYLNALERQGGSKDVGKQVRRIISLLDDDRLALTFDEQREANILRLQLDIELVQLGEQKAVTPRLLVYDMYVGETEHRRLRPEIEAPVLSDPIDPTKFTDWSTTPMVGTGRRTKTRSSSHDVFSAEGGMGRARYSGETHEQDVEGNEVVKLFAQNVDSEKAKAELPASRAWRDYSVRRLPVRMANTGQGWRLPERLTGQRDFLDPARAFDGDHIFVAQELNLEMESRIIGYFHDQRAGREIRRIGTVSLPATAKRPFTVTAAAVDDQNFYVGTVNGLVIFQRGPGTPVTDRERSAALTGQSGMRSARAVDQLPAQPDPVTDSARRMTENDGLPGNQILSLAAAEGKLYIGIGPAGGGAGDCGLAVLRPAENSFEVLASSRSREARNPFDGEEFYQIDRMLPAPDGSALWLAVNGNPDLNGLWRLDPAASRFTRAAEESRPIIDMQWADGKIVYSILGSGIAEYDPAADRKSWLLGYIPSKFTGEEPPQPPAGLSGAPEYGYAKTRLWPFALNGDDLFTVGWQSEDVLLHRRGQAAAPKSIFNPDAGVVTGKSYLMQTSDGVLLIQQDGGSFVLHRTAKPDGTKIRADTMKPARASAVELYVPENRQLK